jgi:hypothetical protein
MLINETLDHVVQSVGFLHQSFYFLTSIRGPVDLRSEVGKSLLLILDFNDFILNGPQLLIEAGYLSDLLVAQLDELVFDKPELGINLSNLVE